MSINSAGKLQMVLDLLNDKDEDGNYIEPVITLTNEEIMQLLDIN